jgi:hypothetical protein
VNVAISVRADESLLSLVFGKDEIYLLLRHGLFIGAMS